MLDAIARKYQDECVAFELGSAKDTERWSTFLPRPIHITPTICLWAYCGVFPSLSLSLFCTTFPPSCSFNFLFSLSLFHQTKQRYKFSNCLQSALVALGNCILLCASFLFLCSQKLTLCPTIKGRQRGAGGHFKITSTLGDDLSFILQSMWRINSLPWQPSHVALSYISWFSTVVFKVCNPQHGTVCCFFLT